MQQKGPSVHLFCTLENLRKFTEHSDIIQSAVKSRISLTHRVSRVQWAYYKYPLPKYVYDIYMKYWEEVFFIR
jgi:hypothetical protein